MPKQKEEEYKVIFLNKYTKGKNKEELIEGFKNIRLDHMFTTNLLKLKNL